MNPLLKAISNALDNMAQSILNASTNDGIFTDMFGWNFVPLNRKDLAHIAISLSHKVIEVDVSEIDIETENFLNQLPGKINNFVNNSIPQLFAGNNFHAVNNFFGLINWINVIFEPFTGWQTITDPKAMPAPLARKLRNIEIELNNIVPKKEELQSQIKLIQEATLAAETLPTDLESLKEARTKVDKLSLDSAEAYGKIDTYKKDSENAAKSLQNKLEEAEKIVAQCEDAYKITTTKGLAASFDQRAIKLTNTMWVWVVGLLFSLAAGGWIGAARFQALAKSLEASNPQWGVIWMDFGLSLIGLAAPVWFAWLATKQINQRFRLSEDYAFKASVAKAYEGYRKEAARIDLAFEARLFSSALTRLEEAPLRLVENDYHGSPWHEFFSSKAFQNALEAMPDLKNQFIDIAKKGISTFSRNTATAVIKEVDQAQE